MIIEKTLVKSPLNYVGGKYKLLPQILPLLPNDINIFIDLFSGGLNVGANVKANTYIVNDIETEVIRLIKHLYNNDVESIIKTIHSYIDSFQLNRENKEAYLHIRNEYNKQANKDILQFYTLICHSFSNQIRFNSKGHFNMPFGKRTFNDRMKSNLIEFIKNIQQKEINFHSLDFRQLDYSKLGNNDLVYCDPPYLITTAAYNEGNGWTEKDEIDLLSLLNELSSRGVKFALSNVFENKGKRNDILIEWAKKYNVNYLNHTYSNCNYQAKDKTKDSTIEVLVTNY